MIDISLYGDLNKSVDKKCKKLYKKSFFDRSWKKESAKIMNGSIKEIYAFIK